VDCSQDSRQKLVKYKDIKVEMHLVLKGKSDTGSNGATGTIST
jgi:hypothetical protein